MTTLDGYKQRAQFGGGDAWIEELLIRGKPGGGIKGGHVAIGWTAQGVDQNPIGGTAGPFPVTVAAADPAFAQVCQLLNAAAIDQVAALTAERDDLAAQLAAAQETIAQLQGQL